MQVTILVGDEAFDRVHDKTFQENWSVLCDYCLWATAFQHPDFVLPWYEAYREQYEPIILYSENADGSLMGLLTLTLSDRSRELTAAGDIQAEYQCWLELPEGDNAFIKGALSVLGQRFPKTSLSLKYFPLFSPASWIDAACRAYRGCSVEFYRRPLIRITPGAVSHEWGKKRHRQNYNKLSKAGSVQFNCITDHHRFTNLLSEICVQSDFRKGAIHNVTPFISDPRRRGFYAELHRRGLLHVTVLSREGKVISSHMGVMSRNCLHLVTISHAPSFAAHSPGSLHLAMLGVHLEKEKIPLYDLTPGNDKYKERFATEHDRVFSLRLYGTYTDCWKDRVISLLKRSAKMFFSSVGLSTADVRAKIRKVESVKEIGLMGICEKMYTAMSPVYLYIASPDREEKEISPVSVAVSVDALGDLIRYHPHGSQFSKQEFLATAIKQLEKGHKSYTVVREGKLVLCCWVEVVPNGRTDVVGEQIPGSIALLSRIYVNHRLSDDGLIRYFISKVAAEAKSELGVDYVYLIGALRKRVRKAIELAGFRRRWIPEKVCQRAMVSGGGNSSEK